MTPNKLLQQFFGAAIMLLLAAIAIREAVGLLGSVWKQLVIVSVVIVIIGSFAAWIRSLHRGW
jgi:hypothetical protein